MVGVLHKIVTDPDAKDHFSKSSGTESSYQALKEKLLQQVCRILNGLNKFILIHCRIFQVGPMTVLDNTSAAPQRKKRLFPERPYLTLDFLPSKELIHANIGPLGKIPVSSQESAVIEDLLFCFVGIEGTHIKPMKQANNLELKVDETLDPSLKELIQRISPLCQYYSTVVSFAEDKDQQGAGRVNQALSGALFALIKDYYIFVTQLETQHRRGELTLNKIWFFIQPTLATMAMLADICTNIEKMSARGGKTISLLHQLFMSQAGGNDNCRAVALFLVESAAKPYFEILSRWLHRGLIIDSGKDFFVEDNEVIERSALPLEYSDDYWERRYSIRMDQIPGFLHNHSDMILRTGTVPDNLKKILT